jgi:hypothetical protein
MREAVDRLDRGGQAQPGRHDGRGDGAIGSLGRRGTHGVTIHGGFRPGTGD